MESTQHPFDKALELTGESGRYTGETSPLYANMVGPFGGVIAAVLLRAVMNNSESRGEPVTLTVNFVAPVKDGSFGITAVCVRTNRSNQHWYLEMLQDGKVTANGTAIFAVRRETWGVTDIERPEVPAVEGVSRLEGDFFPEWVKRYDIRPVKGGIPPLHVIEGEDAFEASEGVNWVRDDKPRPLDHLSLAGLCDTFFPRVYVRRDHFTAAGTVSMTIYFHADAATCAQVGDAHVLGHARAQKFYNTYSDQSAEIWAPDGTLLATTHQVVYYKD